MTSKVYLTREDGLNKTVEGTHNVQIGSHDNKKIGPVSELRLEEFRILDSLRGAMNGTGSHDDEETIVLASENSSGVVASRCNGPLRGRAGDNFVA